MAFNPLKPYNNLSILPLVGKMINYDSPRILKQLIKSKVALAKLDTVFNYLNTDNKEFILKNLIAIECVESSQIENIDITTEKFLKIKYIKQISKEQKETLDYKKALLYGYELIENKWFLDINWILEIWKILSIDKGVVRKTPWVTIKKSSIFWSEIIYTPPAWINSDWNDIISNLLNNYEKFFNEWSPEIDPLIQIALIHYQFEAIHPFYDWNWRTWRILMMLYLILHKQLDYPVIFLSWFINKYKSEYYESLMEITIKWKWEEFIMYILAAIEVQSNQTIEKIEKILSYQKDIKERLNQIESIKSKDLEILEQLLSHNIYVSVKELQDKTKVSVNTWTKLFKNLIDNGFWKEIRIGNIKAIKNSDLLNIFI